MKHQLVFRQPRFVEDGAVEILIHDGHDLVGLVHKSEDAALGIVRDILDLIAQSRAQKR